MFFWILKKNVKMYTYSFRGNLITQVFSTQTQLLNVSTGKSPIAFNILLCNNVSEQSEQPDRDETVQISNVRQWLRMNHTRGAGN